MNADETIAIANVRLVSMSKQDLADYSEELIAAAYALSKAIRYAGSDDGLVTASLAVFKVGILLGRKAKKATPARRRRDFSGPPTSDENAGANTGVHRRRRS